MLSLFAIAAGGALGAVARHGVGVLAIRVFGHGFPVGTLAVNILGSGLMGVLIVLLALRWSPPEAVRLFLVVGLLGAFTTFSTFSLDLVALLERGAPARAWAYALASILLSVGALVTGMAMTRKLLGA